MREQLEKRLTQLKAEFESGQKMLADLDATLLRISGAIQVIEEELERAAASDGHVSEATTLLNKTPAEDAK